MTIDEQGLRIGEVCPRGQKCTHLGTPIPSSAWHSSVSGRAGAQRSQALVRLCAELYFSFYSHFQPQRGFVTKSRVPPMINSEGLRKLHPSSSTSIPHIPFVILHLMSIQQITILFLEGFGAIVFLLIGNVLFHLWNI